MDEIERKTMQDIKDYVNSLDTADNKVYQENYLLIMSCFSKAIEFIEENAKLRQALVSGQLPLPSERFDAEDWLGECKDIWNHPRVTDRNDKESYEVADLMAEFANWYYGNGNLR